MVARLRARGWTLMATQQVDQQLIDQTRREISKLVAEIEELANRDIAPGDFYAEYLRRISTALAARASALWMRVGDAGNLQLQFQVNLQGTGLEATEAIRQSHAGLLRYATTQSKPLVIPPHSGSGEDAAVQFSNPTPLLIVIAPILLEGSVAGLVEVFLDADRRSSAQQGYVQFLTRICGEATKYLKNRKLHHVLAQQQLWDRVDTFARTVHGGLNPKQVSYLIANEGRKLIECERLSVAVKRGRKAVVEAISGQDVVEKRSNLVMQMARLASKVIKHGENLVFTGTVEEHWPSDVKKALHHYLEESPSKLLAIVLMRDSREHGQHGKAEAALIAEMIEDQTTPDEFGGRLEVVGRHGSLALYNALEHHRVFLLPVWRMIGNRTQWFSHRTFPKIALVAVAIAALGAVLTLMPWPLRLEGKGELVPEERRSVYAPMTGIIRDVKVDHRSGVEPGTLLAEMQNPDLDRELLKLKGELRAAEGALRGYEAERRDKGAFDPEVGGKINTQKQKIEGLKQQILLVEQQQRSLRVESPIRGQVMDWKPKEKLMLRPVNQGDPLLEVASLDGNWVLEVQFPENVVTHIARAQRSKTEGEKLNVTYVLSAKPDTTYQGSLRELATQVKPVEQENVVDAKIDLALDESTPPLVSGSEVRVKVDCGPHPLGYVLFRELIDFVREYVFF